MIVAISTGEIEDAREPVRAVSGRKGGLKGGVTRMAQLTPEQRSELAKKAAAKRWKKTAPAKGR